MSLREGLLVVDELIEECVEVVDAEGSGSRGGSLSSQRERGFEESGGGHDR